jgi:hypothetical protein
LPFNDLGYLVSIEKDENELDGILSSCTKDYYKLRSDIGEFAGNKRLNGHSDLAAANDSGVTWPEIADFIEANPEAVFTEPA